MHDIEGNEHPDHITLEGVDYWMDWSKFRRGQSFIIPCLSIDKTRRLVLREMRKRGLEVETKVILLRGIRALRVWRV